MNKRAATWTQCEVWCWCHNKASESISRWTIEPSVGERVCKWTRLKEGVTYTTNTVVRGGGRTPPAYSRTSQSTQRGHLELFNGSGSAKPPARTCGEGQFSPCRGRKNVMLGFLFRIVNHLLINYISELKIHVEGYIPKGCIPDTCRVNMAMILQLKG